MFVAMNGFDVVKNAEMDSLAEFISDKLLPNDKLVVFTSVRGKAFGKEFATKSGKTTNRVGEFLWENPSNVSWKLTELKAQAEASRHSSKGTVLDSIRDAEAKIKSARQIEFLTFREYPNCTARTLREFYGRFLGLLALELVSKFKLAEGKSLKYYNSTSYKFEMAVADKYLSPIGIEVYNGGAKGTKSPYYRKVLVIQDGKSATATAVGTELTKQIEATASININAFSVDSTKSSSIARTSWKCQEKGCSYRATMEAKAFKALGVKAPSCIQSIHGVMLDTTKFGKSTTSQTVAKATVAKPSTVAKATATKAKALGKKSARKATRRVAVRKAS